MIIDRRFYKFLLVGVVNTAIGAGIMFALYNLAGWGYWASSAANYIIGSVCSFFLNKYFTFQVKEWSVFMIFSFTVTIIISYGIAYGIAKPAMENILKRYSGTIRGNGALLTGMCLYTGLNYLGQRLVVFRTKEQ
jgi:putative flippase GtrA